MDDRERIRHEMAAAGMGREDLAEALKVSVASVGRLLRLERELKASERDAAFDLLGLDGANPSLRQVPVIGQIAAGQWANAVQEPLGHSWTSLGGKHAFGLRVDGDSMDLLAPPGATVIIDPDDRDLRDGRSYAVMNDLSETTFKRFRNDPARFEPVSSNPQHTVIAIGRNAFTLIGRAVEITMQL